MNRYYSEDEQITIPAGTGVHVAMFTHEGQEFLDLSTISTEIGRTMKLAHKANKQGSYPSGGFVPRVITLNPTLSFLKE